MSLLLDIKTLKDRGFWVDEIRIDRMIVEANTCPKCWKPLEYRAFSNAQETRTFGMCEPCEFAKQFWLDNPVFAAAKRNISRSIGEMHEAVKS